MSNKRLTRRYIVICIPIMAFRYYQRHFVIGREKEGVGTEIEREMHVSRYMYMFLYVFNTEGEGIEEGRETERESGTGKR